MLPVTHTPPPRFLSLYLSFSCVCVCVSTKLLTCTHQHVRVHVHVSKCVALASVCYTPNSLRAYHCLLCFRAIRVLADDGAVALTLPTKVCHGLHHYDVRQQLPPQPSEGGVTHWRHGTLCCCCLVQLPHLVLCCATGEKLDISALIPGNSARKNHRIRLCYVCIPGKINITCMLV